MTIGTVHMLSAAALLVLVGIWGALRHRSDPMRCLAAIQFVFWGAVLNFVTGASAFDDAAGVVFALFAVCLTAAQMTAALTLFHLYFKKRAGKSGEEGEL